MASPHYLEDLDSKLPAIQLLHSLGWKYVGRQEALALRGGRLDQVVLTGVLGPWLHANNRIISKGSTMAFSEAMRRLTDEPYDTLLRTNERVYNLLSLGTSVEVSIAGDRKGRQLQYIHWTDPARNVYHVTDEFSVERTRSHETCRPDLVLFVNGIPVVVIECKRRDRDPVGGEGGDSAVVRSIKQLIEYQKDDHIPRLFQYAQILVGSSVNECRYGTVGSALKFWAGWKEQEAGSEQEEAIARAVNRRLPDEVEEALLAPIEATGAPGSRAVRIWWDEKMKSGDRLATAQDRTLWAMLRPTRLLPFMRDAVIFDAGKKKVARHQQWFAVQATLDRIVGDPKSRAAGPREGGVIWHTTGTGKSITMVMLAKAIAMHPVIDSPRIVLVTDREDLDGQLATTFAACGKQSVRATTGQDLMSLIRENKATVISTIINKFATVMDKYGVRDESPNVFLLVDEGHRTNYGSFAAKMRRVLPNGCYIGFTGTPLLKRDKTTAAKFGGFLLSYPMRTAVEDEAIAPLIYEGRMALLEQNKRAMDAWFDRLTEGLSREHKAQLKRTMARKEVVQEVGERLKLIAFDISQHYRANFQGRGLKGQVAVRSRSSAIRYRRLFQEFGLVNAELIISAPDVRGDSESVEEEPALVAAFWDEMMKRYGGEAAYNRDIKDAFARGDDTVELLIVVDKLLTGFDEPRNTVLYIDKPLEGHAILQAIARVNRLFEGKESGYVIDYRGILGKLDTVMKTYDALAAFDPADVDLVGAVIDVDNILADLPQHHGDVWAVFKAVKNKRDNEAMEQHLGPANRREAFYGALRIFTRTLASALGSERLYETVAPARVETYKADFRYFVDLRRSVQSRYADRVDYGQYERQIKKMMETHIHAPEVAVVIPQVNIFDAAKFGEELARHEGAASKADTIANRLRRTCIERMEEDPVFFRRFADLVQDVIDDYRAARISDQDYLRRMEENAQTLRQGHNRNLPPELDGPEHAEARAFFGVLGEHKASMPLAAELALEAERIARSLKIVDWVHSPDAVKDMEDALDDFLFDARDQHGIDWSTEDIDAVLKRLLAIAKKQAGAATRG